MNSLREKIKAHAKQADEGWGLGYGFFSKVINDHQLKRGIEVGVAFGGHSEAILKNTDIEILFGVDPYQHYQAYDDAMNLPQEEFDELHRFTLDRLAMFGSRYRHIRKYSVEAAKDVPDNLDFVYLDGDHSYQGVFDDLTAWFSKVRLGGIIGGHDYGHIGHPGVKQAADEFFRRFGWKIHIEGEGVWWVKKEPVSISFLMPAYNYGHLISESITSIMDGNFQQGDELIVVDDASTDDTVLVLEDLKKRYPALTILRHARNRGGAAARNTGIEQAKHSLLFCLDADNLLAPGSVPRLKDFLMASGADVATFEQMRFFTDGAERSMGATWTFWPQKFSLARYLSTTEVPGCSGNYLFTKESWQRAGGYPEGNWLDTWAFGFLQLATGSKMMIMPGSHYYHRHGHQSYYARESMRTNLSLTALGAMLPFLSLIDKRDVDYLFSARGRYVWFEKLDKHPLRLAKKSWSLPWLNPSMFAKLMKKTVKQKLPRVASAARAIKKRIL